MRLGDLSDRERAIICPPENTDWQKWTSDLLTSLKERTADIDLEKHSKDPLALFLSSSSIYMPAKVRAIRAIWQQDLDTLHKFCPQIANDRFEKLIADWAGHFFLSMVYYPEKLEEGYLFLKSSTRENPSASTSYFRTNPDKTVFCPDMKTADFGYDEPEYKALENWGPVFVHIDALNLSDDERLPLYRRFKELQREVGISGLYKELGFKQY